MCVSLYKKEETHKHTYEVHGEDLEHLPKYYKVEREKKKN